MCDIDAVCDVAWEARDLVNELRVELAATKTRLESTRDKLALIGGITEERILRIEAAFKAYVREAPNGPFSARERALDMLQPNPRDIRDGF